MKKLLVLGGSYFQIPAILYAKEQGYYVITCDYLPNNPGHVLSDEYHNVSTTDFNAVLSLSEKLQIDGILCFASDPAAPTAAYVSEKLGLPGNTFSKVTILGEKHLWRKFLKENGFNTPRAKSYTNLDTLLNDKWELPVMVKPIDSSGSKGVVKVMRLEELDSAFTYAMSFSRAKRVIVEEFIERVGPQIGGDGFYGENKLEFICFGDQVVDVNINPFVPCGMTFPSNISTALSKAITYDIERVLSIIGFKNLSFNLEVMLDKKGRIFLMELGPRNGGNCIPEVIHNYSGVDMVALAVEAAMGKKMEVEPVYSECKFAYYALHSERSGVYKGYEFLPSFKGLLNKSYIFKEKGDEIQSFQGSNATIGILLLEFFNHDDMHDFYLNPDSFIKLNLE